VRRDKTKFASTETLSASPYWTFLVILLDPYRVDQLGHPVGVRAVHQAGSRQREESA
jgi:hypothetical protein